VIRWENWPNPDVTTWSTGVPPTLHALNLEYVHRSRLLLSLKLQLTE